MIQTLIADTSSVAKSILKEIVLKSHILKNMGEVSSVKELKSSVSSLNPDIVIIDEDFFGNDKAYLLIEYLESKHLAAIVFYSQNVDKTPFIKNIHFIQKPEFIKFSSNKIQEYADFLEQEILAIKSDILFDKHPVFCTLSADTNKAPLPAISLDYKERNFQAVVIGVSTGGPSTLLELIKALGQNYPLPIFITQHIDSFFDKNLIVWLNNETSVPIHLAENDTKALPGHVYFAPSDMHLVFKADEEDGFHMILNHDAPVNFLRPAVDKMFESAAAVLGAKTIAIVLTGMGADGAKGCKRIKDLGGYTITQDEESCVIYGMPKAAYEAGGSCEVLALNQIADRLWELSGKSRELRA